MEVTTSEDGDLTNTSNIAIIDPDYAPYDNRGSENASNSITTNQPISTGPENKPQVKKITSIITEQINTEINGLENDIYVIDQRLNQTRLVLDRLRAAMLISYYDRAKGKTAQAVTSGSQTGIHPAIKAEIGKSVPREKKMHFVSTTGPSSEKSDNLKPAELLERAKARSKVTSSASVQSGATKHRVVVGNVSKYISTEYRQKNDQSTHKWMMYVRGPREKPSLSHVVEKVWFFLHPSYKPNDLVEIKAPPFHLTRRGWGEFPVRVQLHLKDSRNRKIDIIHHLKLDRSYTGEQTLGAETHVDVEIESDLPADVKPPHVHNENQNISICKIASSAESRVTDQTIKHSSSPQKLNGVSTSAPKTLSESHLPKLDLNIKVKSEPVELDNYDHQAAKSVIHNAACTEHRQHEQAIDDSECLAINSPKPAVPSLSYIKHQPKPTKKSLPAFDSKKYVVDQKPTVVRVKSEPQIQTKDLLRTMTTNSLLSNGSKPQNKTKSLVSLLNLPQPKKPLGISLLSKCHTHQPKPVAAKLSDQDGIKKIKLSLNTEQTQQTSYDSRPASPQPDVYMKCKLPTGKVLLIPQKMFQKTQGANGYKIQPTNKRPAPASSPVMQPKQRKLNHMAATISSAAPINLCTPHKLPPVTQIHDIECLITHLAQIHPLTASGKQHHPVLMPSAAEYQSWPLGKRRALEWQRSKSINKHQLNFINENQYHFADMRPWSTKHITLWCRRYLYTPPSEGDSLLKISDYPGGSNTTLYSDIASLVRSSNKSTIGCDDNDGDIEIMSISQGEVKAEKQKGATNDPSIPGLSCVVNPTAEEKFMINLTSQVGAKLDLTVKSKNIGMPLTSTVLLSLYNKFMEDLMRKANSAQCRHQKSELTNDDVYAAIKSNDSLRFLNDFVVEESKQSNGVTVSKIS